MSNDNVDYSVINSDAVHLPTSDANRVTIQRTRSRKVKKCLEDNKCVLCTFVCILILASLITCSVFVALELTKSDGKGTYV